jgi:hypothetical protein
MAGLSEIEDISLRLEDLKSQFRKSSLAPTANWAFEQGQQELKKLEDDMKKLMTKKETARARSTERSKPPDSLAEHQINSRVDLTPPSMKQPNHSSGKPHVDAVVQPKVRSVPLGTITAEALLERRKSLRSTVDSESIWGEGHPEMEQRSKEEIPEKPKRSSFNSNGSVISVPARTSPPYIPPPPPPPLPKYEAIQPNTREQDENLKDNSECSECRTTIEPEMNVMPEESASQIKTYSRSVVAYQRKSPLANPERGRSLTLSDVMEAPVKRSSSKSTTRSIRSKVSFSSRSRSRSTSKSRKSSNEDEEKEIDIDEGADTRIKKICERFMIEGPFLDDELNVLHVICTEYINIAALTLSRKGAFSRTKPHHQRVYYYLASSRRSKWFDIKRSTIPSSESRLLDFIFRKILRSRSLTIRKPTMQLDGLDRNRVLDTYRFEKIMSRVFQRRKALIEAAVGDLTDFKMIV